MAFSRSARIRKAVESNTFTKASDFRSTTLSLTRPDIYGQSRVSRGNIVYPLLNECFSQSLTMSCFLPASKFDRSCSDRPSSDGLRFD